MKDYIRIHVSTLHKLLKGFYIAGGLYETEPMDDPDGKDDIAERERCAHRDYYIARRIADSYWDRIKESEASNA